MPWEVKKLTKIDVQDLKNLVLKLSKSVKFLALLELKLGGKSAPEIALSIISQLVSEVYKK